MDSTFVVLDSGKYYVATIDYLGNQYFDTVQVSICQELTIPNIITPDGDFYNENFVIKTLDITKNNSLTIFNRWGEKVYFTNNYRNDWNGKGLNEGIYYYQLFDSGSKKLYRGWIELKR